MQRKKIVLTGGGTAGHVLPHFSIIPYLKDYDIYYIGSHDGIERELVQQRGIEYHAVASAKLRRSFDLKNILIPFKVMKGTRQAKKILKQIKPDVVFSKGGFVAYPVVRAAAKLNIPVIAHESDITLGLANRLSTKHCKTVCTTFEETAEGKKNFVHTGSPIRPEIYRGIAPKSEGKNLLVMGGSLGAQKINDVLRKSIDKLDFNIVHICGRGKKDERYSYTQLEFVDNIQDYFAWADVVVSRAGSNALCELLALKKSTLFIPLSTGRGDQIQNAEWVERNNYGMVLQEAEMTPELFVKYINKTDKKRFDFPKGIDGTKKIAEIIISC